MRKSASSTSRWAKVDSSTSARVRTAPAGSASDAWSPRRRAFQRSTLEASTCGWSSKRSFSFSVRACVSGSCSRSWASCRSIESRAWRAWCCGSRRMSTSHSTSSRCARRVTASLSRGGAHHGARSSRTSANVSGFSTSHEATSSTARSTRPWCRSSRTTSVSRPPRSGEIGSSRNRGTSASCTNPATCWSVTFPSAMETISAPSSTTRRALTGSLSHRPTRSEMVAAATRSRMIPSWRKFSPTNSWSPRPSSSLRFGISAVCGIGSPSGCLNRAVTANQSAIAPTIEASAPAFTNPSQPSCPRVATYTTAASTSRPTAIVRIFRSPSRRASSAAGSGVIMEITPRSRVMGRLSRTTESRPCLSPGPAP